LRVIDVVSNKDFPQDELTTVLQGMTRPALFAKPSKGDFNDLDIRSVLRKLVECRGLFPEGGILVGSAWLAPGPAEGKFDQWFQFINHRIKIGCLTNGVATRHPGKVAPGPEQRAEQGERPTVKVDDVTGLEGPRIGDFHRQVFRLRERRMKALKPIVADLQRFLDNYAGKRFATYRENAELAETVSELAREAGCELHYEGQSIRLYCIKRARSKSGDFDVRPHGSSKPLKTLVVFPSLEAVPIGHSAS
jgi:hypothetical protein